MAFEGLTEKLQGALRKLSSKGKLTEDNVKEGMREVRMALLEADVNYAVAKDFIKKVTARCVGTEITGTLSASQQVIKIVNEEMTQLMGGENARLTWSSGPLTVYMLYRPAAINQLQVVGKQVNVPVYEHGTQDPVKTALEAVERARYLGRDVLIIDTAGRLHIDQELMDELVRIKENVHPQEILLVVDAMTGQDAVNVAQTFNEKLDIDGVILTKLDGDTRGGAALSVRAVTGKPIKFSGTGEKLSEIEPFHPDRMASRILGMGDVLTLIDKASEAFDQEDAEKLAKKARTADLTLDDFLDQMQSMKKMGGIKSMLEMLPGMSGKDIDVDENAMKKPEAIIRSMTPKERRNPGVLNASRRKRIAAGSGTTVQDVNQLIRQFDQAKQMMKQVTQMKGKGRMRMRFPGMR